MNREARVWLFNEYRQRVNSLLADGYVIRHECCLWDKNIIRLHHMANGNDIVINADFNRGSLVQKTNHVVTHSVQL